ncbi:MAG TPA: zf-HC2 domain-containing protein [Pyrinomonadaceae bacterium]|nr:zf-HC2 domain-containing protein [Pyrinomonadaceae bacterium]
MDHRMDSPDCERSLDLMAFIYNEMSAGETREFESHLHQCGNCRREAASFGVVRESIVAWRDEVLTGFVPATATPARRSAIAAFQQFFDLSPLWLKGAAAFAVVAFCVLAGLLYVNLSKQTPPLVANSGATYTQQDVDRLVKEALAKQQVNTSAEKTPERLATLNPSPQPQKSESKRTTKNRRPLSRAEREQLAADLRLLPIDDDLDLISDRINHEEK